MKQTLNFITLSALLTLTRAAGHSSSTITSHPVRAAATATAATAAGSPSPLTDYTFAYSAVPSQVNPFAVGRGPQWGYNQCDNSTAGPGSLCQTLIVNDLSDFCLWGSPGLVANETIGDIEAATVAYCTKPHGARLLPAGAITGAQFMRTSAYIQITGYINQTALNLQEADSGGELDPHGADLLGNPLGGLVYSSGLSGGDNKTEDQAVEWNNFIGGGQFCIKLCFDGTKPGYCENRYDLLGCSYNMPASYVDKEFTSCEGELQDIVGTYTSGGQTLTYSQPSSLAADTTLPWTPRIPQSSNCVTYQSTALFTAATTALVPTSTPGATTSKGATGTTKTSSGSKPTSTSSGASSSSTSTTGGAGSLKVSAGAVFLVGVIAALAA